MDPTLQKFIESGLPVLPTNASKEPMIYSHKFLDTSLPTVEMYAHIPKCNYALKCGNIQTKIECIDFDLKNDLNKADPNNNIWARFKQLFDIAGLYVETTPSGGYHICYRCDTVEPSVKLAYCAGQKGAVIETRGTGGYFVCAPSKSYIAIQGNIFEIPYITMDRVDDLKSTCKGFNECPERTATKIRVSIYSNTYNKKHAAEMLEKFLSEGWTIYREHTDRYWLTRPGKAKGVSGTIYKDSGVFYCFTTGTEYSENTAYSPYKIIQKKWGLSDDDMDRHVCEEIGEKYIKGLIEEILTNELKMRDYTLKITLHNVVIADMEKRGTFYNLGRQRSAGFYYFDKELYPCDIGDPDFCCLMYQIYGLTKTEGYCRKLFEDIKNYALSSGNQTIIRRYTCMVDGYIYIDNFDGEIYKISEKDVELVPNGTDGVMFLKSNNTPVQYEPKDIGLFDVIFKDIVFDSEYITEQEYKELFFYWILSIYFLTVNKPICVFFGEKGSGKSFVFKTLLYLLFGNMSAMKVVPEKKENFVASVTNNKLVIFDNADTGRIWLNDALATCATGGTESMRELYVTNKEASYDIDCFIGLTSRTPRFTRDDVADRLLLFPVKRFDTFIPDESLIKNIMDNRNAVMSVIFDHIKKALLYMHKPNFLCCSRMGSFENFCRKMKGDTEVIFKKLISDQKDFSEDTFTEIFREYCSGFLSSTIIKTSAELASELSKICRERYLKYTYSGHAIGYKMKREYDFCEIKKEDIGGRKVQYHITIKGSF